MRILALLLLLPVGVLSQPVPTPAPHTVPPLTRKDESDICSAIKEQAKKDNLKGTGQVWSERGPLSYKVRIIEPVSADVATADTEGVRIGTFSERRQYTFIVRRTGGRWEVAKRIPVCPGGAPVTIQPLSGGRTSAVARHSGTLRPQPTVNWQCAHRGLPSS